MKYQIPQKFQLSTGNVGLKASGKDDLLLIVTNSTNSFCTGVFTKNTFVGAPVLVTKKHLNLTQKTKAILVNAGIANVATGEQGEKDAMMSAENVAKNLGIKKEEVLIASTGVIGQYLPINKFLAKIPGLTKKFHNDIEKAACAIMTTDTFPKIVQENCGESVILGITKGSGMIEPNMATTLTFIMTDAQISNDVLEKKWKEIVDNTFNMVSVDACESTSDMALVISSNQVKTDDNLFFEKLALVAQKLTKKIAQDGEGATKLITVKVSGVKNKNIARAFAKAVVNSDLVKTAIHGQDANWGRIIAAIGSTHFAFDINKLTLKIDQELIFTKGAPVKNFLEKNLFQKKEVVISLDFNEGEESAQAWGCDLSKEYISINGDYRT